jgi:Fur family transcriptional regulator, peroxide stress response regulator
MISQIRMTPQTEAVLIVVKNRGHATNKQILLEVRKEFPKLTATTVHRITNRLIVNNKLARGPSINGVSLIDSNIEKHDHFLCTACDGVKDIELSSNLRKELQLQVNINLLPSSLIIYGDCQNCRHKNIA